MTDFRSVFDDFSDQRGTILLHIFIGIVQTGEGSWKDLRFDDHLSQIDGMFGNLTQRGEDLSLQTDRKRDDEIERERCLTTNFQLCIRIEDQLGQMSNGSGIHNRLCQFR